MTMNRLPTKIYRLPDGLYVQDFTDPIMYERLIEEGEDPDILYFEKVQFVPLELDDWSAKPSVQLHPWKNTEA